MAQPSADVFDGDIYVRAIVDIETSIHNHRSTRGPLTAYVSTVDLPFAILCAAPMLAALQIFVLEGGGGRQDNSFDFEAMQNDRPQLFTDIDHLAHLYSGANKVEIWGPTPLQSFLTHLGQLRERKALSADQFACALDKLTTIVGHIRNAAREGRKSAGGLLELHAHPEAGPLLDIVVNADEFHFTLHTLRRPHYAVSRSESTAELFHHLFEKRRAESRPANGEAPYFYRAYTDLMLADIAAARELHL